MSELGIIKSALDAVYGALERKEDAMPNERLSPEREAEIRDLGRNRFYTTPRDRIDLLAELDAVRAERDALDADRNDIIAENTKLRAALEYYADTKRWPAVAPSPLVARAALEKP